MNDKQHTLKQSISFDGVGLHTGEKVKLTIEPAEVDHGYVFKRKDLDGEPTIPADCELVTTTDRGTTLEKDGASVSTTEHVLAALYGMQVDNALIVVNGPEMPIMDGSSKPFVDAIESVGLQEQDAERDYFVIKETLWYETKEGEIEMLGIPAPGGEFRLTVMVDYRSPVLGTQHASMYRLEEFKDEIAPCRTFVFLKELEQLAKAGLIKGGDLENAIVLCEREHVSKEELQELATNIGRPDAKVEVKGRGVLNNTELKFLNEPARHKLLDIVGDLALVGKPIRGHILAARPGHYGNVEFATKLKAMMKKEEENAALRINLSDEPLMDVNQISELLPHRYPFLLIDKIMEIGKEDIVGVKNVTMNEPFFQGHFPGNPVMPGVLQIEAMAQVGGIFSLADKPDPENYSTYFMKIDNVRFKRKVLPGDTIVFHLKLLSPMRRNLVHMKGVGYVGNNICVEAEMLAQVIADRRPEPEISKADA